MRRPLIAANWKMNKLIPEAVEWVAGIQRLLPGLPDAEIILAPPFTHLAALKPHCKNDSLKLAGQNMFWEPQGAFTGEISGAMLKSAGCEYVILGHSERRLFFHEDDAGINKKISSAQADGLKTILCVGETLEQRNGGQTEEVVKSQLQGALEGIEDKGDLVVAYEPVWAIGTGLTATPDQAQEAHAFIRATLGSILSPEASEGVRILYGGSVNQDNSRELLNQSDIDGALVGGASLAVEKFCAIIASLN